MKDNFQKNFFDDLIHSLRTPLAVVSMESEIALMDNSNTEKDLRKVIQSNLEEARKMSKLLNNLIKIYRDINK